MSNWQPTRAIRAVSLEANSVKVVGAPVQSLRVQSLLRQEEVLTVTANAITDVMTTPATFNPTQQSETSTAIAKAGRDVVMSAVSKVAADITAEFPQINPAVNGVPVQEVSSTTKFAVAQAVRQMNNTASPIEVLHTADEIIRDDIQQPPIPVQMPVGPSLMNDLAIYPHTLIGDIEMQSHVPVMSSALAGPPYQVDMTDYPMQ